jgi:hypothetical protein
MKKEETYMDAAVLTDVLTNLTEESKAIKTFIEKQQKVIGEKDQEIKNLVNSFEQKYSSIQVIAPKPDMTATNAALDQSLNKINSTLESKLANIKQTIEAGPKPITRHFRFLLFPESNTDYYYKMVFGRLIPWSFLFIVVVYLLSVGQKTIEAYQASQYNKEGNQCIAAWNEVYAHESKAVKKAMDKAMIKAKGND